MKDLQLLEHEYSNYPALDNWKKRGINLIIHTDWKNVDKNIPILCYADLLNSSVRHWLNVKQPAIYAGRGYVGNHLYKRRLFHRASANGWANIELKSPPYSRWPLMNLPKHPWKVKEVKNVLIAPSKMTANIWTPELNWRWAESMLDQFPGANVKIRTKIGKQGPRYETLWQDFDWADLIVSQSSAITVEAFWYGKKVISTEPCITWAAEKSTMENWQDPTEPALRDQWHEHLAWSQFTTSEWDSGEVFNLIEKYLGPVISYDSKHTYNIKV